MGKKYDASAIEILSGLDPVKKRPGMYTDTMAPDHLAQEVIDNSVDEALVGYANNIDLTLHKDGSMSVSDNGRGMPVDLHPEKQLPGVEIILTTLHAGGKFSGDYYRYSGGLHGVGISVVNALSEQLEVWVNRDAKQYYMAFKNGITTSPLKEIGSVSRRNNGTTLRFLPDINYFASVEFNTRKLKKLLQTKAVLCPKLNINYTNENTQEKKQWCYQQGLNDYFYELATTADFLLKHNFYGDIKTKQCEIAWCINWSDEDAPGFTESYVNLVPTPLGGTHINGLRSGLATAIREFMQFHKLIPKQTKLTTDDVMINICYLLSIKLHNPEFAGQAKEKLNSSHASSLILNTIKDALSLWLNQHTQQAKLLAKFVLANAQRRQKNAKQTTRKGVISGFKLPGKLIDCTSSNIDETELFIVEGDSAGGSARQARDRWFQAVMPLRGKIMNTWEATTDEILHSKEICDIAMALGIEPDNDDLQKLRYGKVCILADADVDGLHIATLLAALFRKHFTALVTAGHVYIAMPPLFRIDVAKAVHYAIDEAERDACLADIPATAKVTITRFKGLGEMNPQQLRESTMAVDSRHLIQLQCDTTDDDTDTLMDMLLKKKCAFERRIWLEEKGDLASDLK